MTLPSVRRRPAVALSFCGLVVIGLNGGGAGVLIPDQQAHYHADKSTIGLLFFAFAAGYLLSGLANGWLIRRLGVRGQLTLGGLVLAAGSVGSALAPPFAVLLALSLVLALGAGVIDSGYNAFVTQLPNHVSLLNLLHACYGLGALIGPLAAALLLNAGYGWQSFYLLLAPLGVAVAVGSALLLPGVDPPVEDDGQPVASVGRALRRPEVWLALAFLNLYVGVEVTIGNWGYSYLTQHTGQAELLAGWVVSGYWLGLTLGRFVVHAVTSRLGIGTAAMMYAMVAGLCLCSAFIWAVPGSVATSIALLLTGVFLGPIFPTVIAVVPRLTPASLVSTAIGLLVGASVFGGAILPWGAGTLAQHAGLGTLPPYLLLLGLLSVLSWWSIARRLGPEPAGAPEPADPARVAAAAEAVAQSGHPFGE